MSVGTNAPVIIKRKKIVAGDGHHGGAWKVAYADFVTAMMAFFMLMWLLNATTEQQRKGIADYFSPTIPIARVSAGGDGTLGGDNVFTQNVMAQSGVGGIGADEGAVPFDSNESDQLDALNDLLFGRGGEALFSENELRHVVTKVTDEGLVIEIFDLPDAPLFDGLTTENTPILQQILTSVGMAAQMVSNKISVEAFVAAQPVVLKKNAVWDLSGGRADHVRTLLQSDGIDPARIFRVTGYADRDPAVPLPMSERNNRIKVVLLRDDQR